MEIYTFHIKKDIYFGVFRALYNEKSITSLFDLQSLAAIGITEEHLIHIWNPEEILSQKQVRRMQKY